MNSLKKVNNWVHAVSDDQGLIRDAIKKKPEMGPTEAQLSGILTRLNTPACHSMIGYLVQRIAVHPNKKIHWRTMLKGLRIVSYSLERGSKEVYEEISNYKSYFEQISTAYQYYNRLNQDKGAEVKVKAAKIVEYLSDPRTLNLEKSKNRMGDGNAWDESTNDRFANRESFGGYGKSDNRGFDNRDSFGRDDRFGRADISSDSFNSARDDRAPRFGGFDDEDRGPRFNRDQPSQPREESGDQWNRNAGWGSVESQRSVSRGEEHSVDKGPTITASDFFGVKTDAIKKSPSPAAATASASPGTSKDPFAAFSAEPKQPQASSKPVESSTEPAQKPTEVSPSQNIHSELDDLLGLSTPTPKSQAAAKKDTLDDLFSEPQSSTIVTNPFDDEPTSTQAAAKPVSTAKKTTTDDIWNF